MTASAHVARVPAADRRSCGSAATRSRSRRATTRRRFSSSSCTGSRPTRDRPPRRPLARGKARALTLAPARAAALGARPRLDVALAHGSHELTMTARRLGIPSSTTFDYEWAWLQHQLGCRAATKVVVPTAIPPERLARYGAEPPKLVQYEGLKEEYYLSDFEPDPDVARPLGARSAARADRAPPAAGRLALPPPLEPAVSADARAPRPPGRRARDRPAAHRGAARVRARARTAVRDRSRRQRSTRRASSRWPISSCPPAGR